MNIEIQELVEADIKNIMDYWLNPNNSELHKKRGISNNSNYKDLVKDDPKKFREQIATRSIDRAHATAIITVDGKKVGHILLNDIRDSERIRMHFHIWRNSLKTENLGQAISILSRIFPTSLSYFFKKYDVNLIIGEVAVYNKLANFVMNRLGYMPEKTVMANYFGEDELYNRYVFVKS